MAETPKSSSEIAPRSSASLLDTAFNNLPAEQRDKLLGKALEKKLELEVDAVKAAQRHERSSIDMHNTVRQVRDLESATRADYNVKSTYETASGHTTVEVKKTTNLGIIVVAVVIAIVFLLLFAK